MPQMRHVFGCHRLFDSAVRNNHNLRMNNIREGQSNILAACILSAGLVVASVIIAKPRISFQFASVSPPISLESARQQFTTQMEAQMKGKHTDMYDGKRYPLQALEVGDVTYDAKAKTYLVDYTLYWRGPGFPTTGTGCYFRDLAEGGSYSASCTSGDEKSGASHRQTTVTINLRAPR